MELGKMLVFQNCTYCRRTLDNNTVPSMFIFYIKIGQLFGSLRLCAVADSEKYFGQQQQQQRRGWFCGWGLNQFRTLLIINGLKMLLPETLFGQNYAINLCSNCDLNQPTEMAFLLNIQVRIKGRAFYWINQPDR